MDIKLIAKNPTAYHNYDIEDKLEAGIVLSGTEIKSIRSGKVNLKDTYAILKNGEKIISKGITNGKIAVKPRKLGKTYIWTNFHSRRL